MTEQQPPAWSHPSAIVEEGAQLGPGVKVWHFSHVCAGAVIGAGASLGQGAYVAPTARVGAGCRVQNHVSLYDGVSLAEDVFVGPSVVFTNVRTPRAHVSRRHEYDATVVERGASIGANATLVCGVRLGAYCMIGAGAVVTRDALPFSLWAGNPARQLGWVCQCGARLKDPSPRIRCLRCGSEYVLVDDELYWVNEDKLRARMARAQQPLGQEDDHER